MTTSVNRRAFERFALQPMYTSVVVDRIRGGRLERVQGHAYDVSEGGIRLELDERLEVGEHINVTLKLPGARRPIHLGCDVVWLNTEEDDPAMPRTAVRIETYLDDESRRQMHRFLSTRPATRAA